MICMCYAFSNERWNTYKQTNVEQVLFTFLANLQFNGRARCQVFSCLCYGLLPAFCLWPISLFVLGVSVRYWIQMFLWHFSALFFFGAVVLPGLNFRQLYKRFKVVSLLVFLFTLKYESNIAWIMWTRS